MLIGVVSDTHSLEIPKQLVGDLKKADFIIHAGDFCSLDDLEKFKRINEMKAVHGNSDEPALKKLLPRKQILKCGKFSIGVFHGEGAPHGLLDKVKGEFKNDRVDCVIFGHSHRTMNEEIDGILYFNPGSPNDTVFAPFCSYGLLTIDEKITGKIIKVKSYG